MSKKKNPVVVEEKRGPGRPRTLPEFNSAIPAVFHPGGPLLSLLRAAERCVSMTQSGKEPNVGLVWRNLYVRIIVKLEQQRVLEGRGRNRQIPCTKEEQYAKDWARHHGKWNPEQ